MNPTELRDRWVRKMDEGQLCGFLTGAVIAALWATLFGLAAHWVFKDVPQ